MQKNDQTIKLTSKKALFTSMAAVALLGSATTAVMATTHSTPIHAEAVTEQETINLPKPGDTITADARVHVLKDGVLTWITIPNITKTVGDTWVDWTIPAPVIDGYTPDEDTMVIRYISDKNVFNTESNIIYTKNGGTNGIPASTPDKKLGDYTFNINSSSNPGFNQRLEYTGANEWTPNDGQFDVTVRGRSFSDWSIEAYRPDDPSQESDEFLDMITDGTVKNPQLGTHRVPITRYYGFYEKKLNVEGYINITVTLDGKTTGDLNNIGNNNNNGGTTTPGNDNGNNSSDQGSDKNNGSDNSSSSSDQPGSTTSNDNKGQTPTNKDNQNGTTSQSGKDAANKASKPTANNQAKKPTTLLQTGVNHPAVTIATIASAVIAGLSGAFGFIKRF